MKSSVPALRSRALAPRPVSSPALTAPAHSASRATPRSGSSARAAARDRLELLMIVPSFPCAHDRQPPAWKSSAKADIFLTVFSRAPQMAAGDRYEFRQYRLDTRGRLLYRNGQRVVLAPKAVDLLIALVEAQGEPVGKQELLQKVWPGTVVEEGSLTSHISLLRRVLGEGVGGQRFIE